MLIIFKSGYTPSVPVAIEVDNITKIWSGQSDNNGISIIRIQSNDGHDIHIEGTLEDVVETINNQSKQLNEKIINETVNRLKSIMD